MTTNSRSCLALLPAIAAALLALASCASMGRPQGGPRDVEPPVFLGSNPGVGALNVSRSRITLNFDENVNIQDATSKVVVSPVQTTPPRVTALGKSIQVELRDSLVPDATYTIDFSDAVRDLNEGNVLDGLAIAFSTGDAIDTLSISGMVFQASNLEPAQGMLVGVHSNLDDSAVSTLPFERITKTNQLGQFTVRNLKPGEYRIYAVNDNNRDYMWDRSEDIAFSTAVLSPRATPSAVSDTLTASDGSDSIVTRPSTLFTPNDIILSWFNENYRPQYLLKYDRPERHLITMQMNAPSDTFPLLTLANGTYAGKNLADFSILNYSATRDTIEYWIKDSTLILQDSILLATRYLRTDTLNNLSWENDTLRFFMKGLAKKKKDEEKKKKEEEKKKKENGGKIDSIPPVTFMNFKPAASGTIEVYNDVYFNASQPVVDIDTAGIHLEMQEDTLWIPLGAPRIIQPKPNRPLSFKALYDWEPGVKYRLTVDSAAVTGIYNQWNNTTKAEFTVRPLEDYSTIDFELTGVEQPAVVEILNASDNPVAREKVTGGHAVFMHLLPGTYYARLFIDSNGNGLYDDGSFTDKRLPEDVYYYPKKLNVRKNWDIQQPWDINELPIDQQKPLDIKKNKPKQKAGEQQENDEEDEDDFYDDPYNQFYQNGNLNDNFNNRRGNNSTRRNSRVRSNTGADRRVF